MPNSAKNKTPRGIPEGPGPYGVGCADVMAGLSTSGVFFRLYYPTEKLADGPPQQNRPSWLPSNQYAKGYGSVMGKKIVAVTLKFLLSKFTLPVMWHGQLSSSRSKYPVIVYSHGLGGCRTTYTSICIDLASMGCVVAAVEHRDKSACCSFIINDNNSNSPDKGKDTNHIGQQWVEYHRAPYEDQELRTRQVNQRKDECIAVLDYLQDLNDGSALENDLDPDFDLAQFQDHLDMEDMAVCGHSFGGATTLACLSRDRRFKCGVCFDAWMYPLDDSHLTLTQPVLFVNTEKFQWKKNIAAIMTLLPDAEATSGPRQMVTIRGTVHQSQSDFSLLLPQFLCKVASMRGELDPHVAMAANNQAAIHFLSNYIGLAAGDDIDAPLTTISEHIMVGTNIKLDADMARVNADTAQVNADTAQVNADTAEVNADTAKVNADTAEMNADTAQVNAETAQVTADTT
ncbi:platelet-activating factor acetylhydrolase-like [Diadema antillarum]|uniref:platelet-activating factor acetylhydrolase-like n=1 Tax=Diadema antillarum TaxID=105358 RepID=UPI003A86554D